MGTTLELVGFGDFILLFLYFTHLRLDLDRAPPEPLAITWLFGLIFVAVGVFLNRWGESLPEEELPQESVGA